MQLNSAIETILSTRLNLAAMTEELTSLYGHLSGKFSAGSGAPLDIEAQLKVAVGAAASQLGPLVEILAEATQLSGVDPTEKIEFSSSDRAELEATAREMRAN